MFILHSMNIFEFMSTCIYVSFFFNSLLGAGIDIPHGVCKRFPQHYFLGFLPSTHATIPILWFWLPFGRTYSFRLQTFLLTDNPSPWFYFLRCWFWLRYGFLIFCVLCSPTLFRFWLWFWSWRFNVFSVRTSAAATTTPEGFDLVLFASYSWFLTEI